MDVFPASACEEEQITWLLKTLNLSDDPKQCKLKAMTGGVTNYVYRFTTKKNKYTIRIYGNNTDRIINREGEIEHIRKINFVDVHATFSNGMVVTYLEGIPLDVEMVADPVISDKIAEKLAYMHSKSINDPGNTNNLFDHMEVFLKSLDPKQVDVNWLTNLYKETREKIEHEMCNSPVALCHNDLISCNILLDGENVQFVDYEYSDYNWPEFDIANHFFEYISYKFDLSLFPTIEQEKRFITTYLTKLYGEVPSQSLIDEWVRRVNIMLKVDNLFWALWGYFQAFNSNVNFPYLEYSQTRLKLMEYDFPIPKDDPICEFPIFEKYLPTE